MKRPIGSVKLSRRVVVIGLLAAGASQAVGLPLIVGPGPAEASPADEDVLLGAARTPGQLSPAIVANDAFYVVTKNAAGDPVIPAASWRLALDGEVNRPVQLDFATLQQLPPVDVTKTLECISNLTSKCELTSFGCELISNAAWRGAVLADVLDLAGGLKPSAVVIAALSSDEFSSAIPVDVALAPDTILAFEMNGAPLPPAHGGPVRLLAPGRYGFKSAKWLANIRPMARPFADWYGQRNWSREAIVKTMSRIDSPAPGSSVAPGSYRIAGIAYAGDRGVAAVEVSADGGSSWRAAAFIEPALGRDTWVRWESSFTIAAGQTLSLVSRATDGSGVLQAADFGLAQPDGASGWHSIEVRA